MKKLIGMCFKNRTTSKNNNKEKKKTESKKYILVKQKKYKFGERGSVKRKKVYKKYM
jgi:hypothetical protein